MNSCKACNNQQCKVYQQRGYRDTEKYVFYQRAYEIRRRCKSKGIKCIDNLKDFLMALWREQEKKCSYSGLEMSLNGYQNNPLAMTVDRIDPALGYVQNNIVLCCSMVNRMKQNMTPSELVKWCHIIVDHLNKES